MESEKQIAIRKEIFTVVYNYLFNKHIDEVLDVAQKVWNWVERGKLEKE